jgi:hypothetical protein
MFYFGACKDEVHKEWLTQYHIDMYVRQFTGDKLKIPGFVPKSKVPPASLLEAAPPKPALNTLAWMEDHDDKPGFPKGVKIPADQIQKWYQHPTHGEQFRQFYDKVIAECGAPEDLFIGLLFFDFVCKLACRRSF